MMDTLQPGVASAPTRSSIPDHLRVQVLALRRTQSARATAQALGVPLGTVKAISSRSGITRDNAKLREFFKLPDPVASTCTDLQPPVAPPQPVTITGDNDLDAVLWLRQVVQTGHAALIDKAMQAAERIQTPEKELEKRYGDYLMRVSDGNVMQAVFGSIGFANIKGLASTTLDKQARRREALARYGIVDAVFATLPQEQFCLDALALVPKQEKSIWQFDTALTNAAFAAQADMAPHTLSDCLYELAFWDGLYRLRDGWGTGCGDGPAEVNAREDYLFCCMGQLRPKSRQEAKSILRYLADHERMDRTGVDAILDNLIG
ncbi:MAG: hypothetical protein K2Y10_10595 [Burkholderiaceae bacterium]|nr:hypothetical protein [Burkholderiaceae bacterium]